MSQKIAPKAGHGLLQSDTLLQLLGGDAVQILKCGICLEFFDLPIVLPCGHTFCLHCLTEMCRHAIRNSSQNSLQDIRIGCPNCRILIYALPVLERNVTCNFIIQSLIELLRAREDRKMQSTGVNTDEVRIGAKIRTPSDSDVARLMQDMDRLTEALGKRNVVDNAYFEIDEIRRTHLGREEKKQETRLPDHSSVKPTAHLTSRQTLLNSAPISLPHQMTTPYVNTNNNIVTPKVPQPNQGILYHQHQPYYRQSQPQQQLQPPLPLLQPHRIPVPHHPHHHLRNRPQQQPHLLNVVENSPWTEQGPVPNNNPTRSNTTTCTNITTTKSTKTHSEAAACAAMMMAPQHNTTTSTLSLGRRQESHLPIKTDADSRSMTNNKMAAASATKSCPDVGQANNSNSRRQPSGRDRKSICSARLDDDPAVMSYSCTPSGCHVTSENHMT